MITGGKLYAIDRTGILKWVYDGKAPLLEAPAVAEDGTLYARIIGDGLYAIDRNGKERWRFSLKSTTLRPALAKGGTIYVADPVDTKDRSLRSRIYAVRPDGKELWACEVDGGVMTLSVGDDGTIYAVLHAIGPRPPLTSENTPGVGVRKLSALRPDGRLAWEYSVYNYWDMSPVVFGKESIALSIVTDKGEGELHLLDRDGKRKTILTADGLWFNTFEMTEDGTIYAGASSGYIVSTYGLGPPKPPDERILSISSDGRRRWEARGSGGIQLLGLGGGDTVYALNRARRDTAFGTLLSIDRKSGRVRWEKKIAQGVGYAKYFKGYPSSLITSDGSIFINYFDKSKNEHVVSAIGRNGRKLWESPIGIGHGRMVLGKDGLLRVEGPNRLYTFRTE